MAHRSYQHVYLHLYPGFVLTTLWVSLTNINIPPSVQTSKHLVVTIKSAGSNLN